MTRLTGALAIAAVALSLALAANAEGFVYWANNGSGAIGRANLDGSTVDQSFILGAPPESPCGVAVSATHIYFAQEDEGWISRAMLDGSSADFNFITGADTPCGVAVNGSHVFWTDTAPPPANDIGRADIDGMNVNQSFIDGGSFPCGVAVNDSHILWANGSNAATIERAELDGTNPETLVDNVANLPFNPCGVAVNGSHVFWADHGTDVLPNNTRIGRAELDGTNIERTFITGPDRACGVAVNTTHIYWANKGDDTIGRAEIDGTNVDQSFITGAINPCGVAVDTLVDALPPPASGAAGVATPSNAFQLGKLKRKKRKGIAILTVNVPGPGEVGLRGPGIKPIRAAGAQASRFTSGGKVKLRIKPHKKGRKAKKLRNRLRKKGKAKRKVRVTYIPTGGLANTKKRKVKLVKK